jgi:ABC-type sulfate transport system permease component
MPAAPAALVWRWSAALLGLLAALPAARRSRVIIAVLGVPPTFTTGIVFLLLLYGGPRDAEHRFVERLLETMLGVALALFFGVAVPWLRTRSVHRKPG